MTLNKLYGQKAYQQRTIDYYRLKYGQSRSTITRTNYKQKIHSHMGKLRELNMRIRIIESRGRR